MEKDETAGRPVRKLDKLLTYNKELVASNTPQQPEPPADVPAPEPIPAALPQTPAAKKASSKRSGRFGRYRTDDTIQAARTALENSYRHPHDYKRSSFEYPIDDDADIKALAAGMGLTVKELVLTALYREMSRQERNGRFVRQRRFGD